MKSLFVKELPKLTLLVDYRDFKNFNYKINDTKDFRKFNQYYKINKLQLP